MSKGVGETSGGWRDIEREKDSEKLVGSVFCKSLWGLSIVGVNCGTRRNEHEERSGQEVGCMKFRFWRVYRKVIRRVT